MKKFISGVLTGVILSSTFAFAAQYVANSANFKVLVNGKEFTSDPPALVVEGRTYLPLRAIGEALNVPVNWNEDLRQAEVGNMSSVADEKTVAESEAGATEAEILTTKDDIYYKENSNIPNAGSLLEQDAYKVEKENGYVFYFYKFSDPSISPIRIYEYLLKNANFMVTCDNSELDAKNGGDLLNLDYYITAMYRNDKMIVMFKEIK